MTARFRGLPGDQMHHLSGTCPAYRVIHMDHPMGTRSAYRVIHMDHLMGNVPAYPMIHMDHLSGGARHLIPARGSLGTM
jgi:hypothetical protein